MMYEVSYILHDGFEKFNKIVRLEAATKKVAEIIVRQKNYKFDSRGKLVRKAEILNTEKI